VCWHRLGHTGIFGEFWPTVHLRHNPGGVVLSGSGLRRAWHGPNATAASARYLTLACLTWFEWVEAEIGGKAAFGATQ
jgi:hypothetical protein